MCECVRAAFQVGLGAACGRRRHAAPPPAAGSEEGACAAGGRFGGALSRAPLLLRLSASASSQSLVSILTARVPRASHLRDNALDDRRSFPPTSLLDNSATSDKIEPVKLESAYHKR